MLTCFLIWLLARDLTTDPWPELAAVAQERTAPSSAATPRRRGVRRPALKPAYEAAAWKFLGGPPGDLGYDIRYNFTNHDIWYVTDGAAGFFISTDDGENWKPSSKGIATSEGTVILPVFSATVDPHDPKTIWVGTQFLGYIYKSIDGGATFNRMDNGITHNSGHTFRGFTVDPRSSDIVYAAAEVEEYVFADEGRPGMNPNTQGGRLFKTTDGGKNWSKIWEGNALARYTWISPQNTDVLYVSTGIFDRSALDQPQPPPGCGGHGVLKSIDGGKSWTVSGKDNGLKVPVVSSLYMKPGDPNTLIAGTGSLFCAELLGDQMGTTDGVYLTSDGAQTWRAVLPQPELIGAVEYCEQSSQIAYAAGPQSVWRSDDGGSTWRRLQDSTTTTWGPEGMRPGIPIDLQIDPDSNCERLFINNYIGGNFLSSDGGRSWRIATRGYSGAKGLGLVVDPSDATHVYAGVRLGAFVSTDSGETWQPIMNGFGTVGIQTMAIDPADGRHLLAVDGEKQQIKPPVYETRDGGTTWITRFVLAEPAGTDELAWGRMQFLDIAFSPSNPKIVYAATLNRPTAGLDGTLPDGSVKGCGIYRSNDGGTTWAEANDSTTLYRAFAAVAVDPTDPETAYAAAPWGEGILKTSDGGKSWSAINQGLSSPLGLFRSLAIHPKRSKTVYAGGPGLFRTDDGGASWLQLTAGLDPAAEVTAIVVDPTNSKVIYVGSSRAGVFYSSDGGAQFQKLTQGLDESAGALPITRLAISSDGTVLYAGTWGRAILRLGPAE